MLKFDEYYRRDDEEYNDRVETLEQEYEWILEDIINNYVAFIHKLQTNYTYRLNTLEQHLKYFITRHNINALDKDKEDVVSELEASVHWELLENYPEPECDDNINDSMWW